MKYNEGDSMKYFMISLLVLMATSSHAKLKPKRTQLYHCVNYDTNSHVTDAIIYESKFGNNHPFYEIEVFVDNLNQDKEFSYIKKVNYLSKYNQKIETFTTGNFRIKLDHVRPGIDGQIWAFARIPEYQVHSFDWSCKDIEGR